MLSTVLDIFRMRQYFNGVLFARDVAEGVAEDASFLNAVRRTLAPLPWESPVPADLHPFEEAQPLDVPGLRGRRLALVATGGSGALAAVTGVWRAFEEAGVRPDVVSVCSGSSLFGFALAAGRSADEVAEFTLGMRAADYVDVNWQDLLRAATTGGKGFAGLVRGERIEESYRRFLGDITLGDLEIPCYAPIWNVEENRLEYIGPRTHPNLSVARAVRVAISIPLFLDPVAIEGGFWCDGGIVDIFPVKPVLEIEDPVDVALAVNCFYPPDFAGETAEGWRERRAAIVHVASQVRTSQQIELARENLARLREACDVLMTDPVPYAVVRGVGFYRQFLDRTQWPDFMRWGQQAATEALTTWRPRTATGRQGTATAARRSRTPRRTQAATVALKGRPSRGAAATRTGRRRAAS